ncbi:MAG: DUF4159 domain-containing protein [Planctomycetota bacterium]|nr:DUF4159 domain-containing protein [Planctomycetota bacterium]
MELAFLLDCSGSMNHTLGTLQEQIKRIAEALNAQLRTVRVAVVVYRTEEYRGAQEKFEVLDFTGDRAEVNRFLQKQRAEGGGEEMVEDALHAALIRLTWSAGARKVAVLMGDEQPKPPEQGRCLEWAKALKQQGIALHAVTASQSAWIYYIPNSGGNWKQQLQGLSAEEKRTFKLPFFTELAAAGGGLSVSSWESKELILWLLAFGLGLNEKEAPGKIDVNKYLEWSKQRDQEETALPAAAAAAGTPLLGWLRDRSDWKSTHHFEGLLEYLGKKLELSGPPAVEVLDLAAADLARFPVLYLSGRRAPTWSFAQRQKLKARLEAGGFLAVDACCADEAFDRAFREALAELFPAAKLERLAPEHPLFSIGHRIGKVRRSEKPCTGELKPLDPELYGLELPDPHGGKPRLAVVYCPHDLGGSWRSSPLGLPVMYAPEDGLALSANIFLWALTK